MVSYYKSFSSMIFENLLVKKVISAIATESKNVKDVIGTANKIEENSVILNHLNIFQT